MSKPPRESEDAKEIITVRVGARMSEEIKEVAEEAETKSEGYREIINLGLEAHEFDRTPAELRDYADRLEAELERSIWDRLPRSIQIMLAGAVLTAMGLVPIVVGVVALEFFNYTTTGDFMNTIIAGGLLTAVFGVVVFILGVFGVLASELRQAISPEVE